MSSQPSDVPSSDSNPSPTPHRLLSKQLSLLLFTHMLLLSLAQAVTQIMAPAAKPPMMPTTRKIHRKDSGKRKNQTLEDEDMSQQTHVAHPQIDVEA
ncbi:hypothetical protein [Leptothoe kymatousa]|uniref:Uncharacterized protein n=1 Tax=Leptothoe kymatousa TAU-MAC 1615 TaxID=2364775 RepID=A0ABS5Y1W8_9CYAN|nr:hypothetical protein [Leptothoe kymatousa]MBT9310990.1 hypothetical protein [Leptothoe kymatousa TAU-MAC 1615]